MKVWCTHCDEDMEYKGVAMDCPQDGSFYICPNCNHRVVIFKDEEQMYNEHPFKTGSNVYYMDPASLLSIGVNIDERCVVCGKDQKNKNYYVDHGLIHCVLCAFKHKHINEKEAKEYGDKKCQ